MKEKTLAIIEIQDDKEIICFRGFFDRPSINIEREEIHYRTISTWSIPKYNWSNVKICFVENYSFNHHKWVHKWTNELFTDFTKCKKTIFIKVFNNNSLNIESWRLDGAYISSFNSKIIYDNNTDEFPCILSDSLTRTVLIEKKNNETMQIYTELEISIDNAMMLF